MAVAPSASASSEQHLSGGGTATMSQVAFNVTIEAGGGAAGSFNCLMAGRSEFGSLHLQAEPTTAHVSGSVVDFWGPGFLIMDSEKTQPIQVHVWADAASQQFELTVVGVMKMDVEKMVSGQFALR